MRYTALNASFVHDGDGNQITRVIGADTFNLSYDAENRLVEVKKNTVSISTFVYDGDGKRVKAVEGDTTTLFVGAHYEITNPGSGQTVTKYYFAGSTRIAMRKYTIPVEMKVEYFLSDHLGSTSLTTDSNGAKISKIKYKPWGEVRSAWKSTDTNLMPSAYALTRQTFTGQYSYMDDPSTATTEGFGLMYYGARFYDPALGRFTSADSIVPGGAQGLDRYAYVSNNPVKYIDPGGHNEECGMGQSGCHNWKYTPEDYKGSLDRVLANYGITTEGGTREQKQTALLGAFLTGNRYSTIYGGTSSDNFYRVHGNIHMAFGADMEGCITNEGTITCGTNLYPLQAFIHEYGHVFDHRYRDLSHWDDDNPNCDPHSGCLASSYLPPGFQNTTDGYFCSGRPCLAHDPTIANFNASEAFADMYMNWVLDRQATINGLGYSADQNGFNSSSTGQDRYGWMQNNTINWAQPSGIPAFLWLMGLR